MPKSEGKSWFQKGKAFIQEKKYREAIECFDKELKSVPSSNLNTWMQKALAFRMLENFSAASEIYDFLIKNNPNFYEAIIAKGRVWYYLGEYEKVLQYAETITILPIKIFLKVLVYFATKELDKARDCINRIPTFKFYKRDFKGSDSEFKILDSVYKKLHCYQAITMFCTENLPGALCTFNEVLQKDKEFTLALKGQALCASYLNRPGTDPNINQIEKLSADDCVDYFCVTGDMYFSKREWSKAWFMYMKALNVVPYFAYPKSELNKINKIQPQYEMLVKLAIKFLSNNNNNDDDYDEDYDEDDYDEEDDSDNNNNNQTNSVKTKPNNTSLFQPTIDITGINYSELIKCFNKDRNSVVTNSINANLNDDALPPIPDLNTEFSEYIEPEQPENFIKNPLKFGHDGEEVIFKAICEKYKTKPKIENSDDQKKDFFVYRSEPKTTWKIRWHNYNMINEDSKKHHDICVKKTKITDGKIVKSKKRYEIKTTLHRDETFVNISEHQLKENKKYGKDYRLVVVFNAQQHIFFRVIENPIEKISPPGMQPGPNVCGMTIKVKAR